MALVFESNTKHYPMLSSHSFESERNYENDVLSIQKYGSKSISRRKWKD